MVDNPIKMKTVLERYRKRETNNDYGDISINYNIAKKSLTKNRADANYQVETFLNKCSCSKIDSYLNEVVDIMSIDSSDNIVESVCDSLSYSKSLNETRNVFRNSELNDNVKSRIDNVITENLIADRIINNHNKLDKVYGINSFFNSRPYAEPDDTIFKICEFVETFNVPRYACMNIALEESIFSSYLFGIPIPRQNIVESVVDYFLLSDFTSTDFEKFKTTLKKNRCITEADCSLVYYIFESEDYANSSDVKDLIKAFKKDENKNPKKVEKIVNVLFGKSISNILDDTPQLFNFFRYIIYLGLFPISVILSIVLLVADLFIQMKVNRTQSDKMLKKFENEIKKVEKNIGSTKNENKKHDLEKYKKTLETCRKKIEDYSDTLYTDDEIYNRIEIDECVNNQPIISLNIFKDYRLSKMNQIRNEAYSYIKNRYNSISKSAVYPINRSEQLTTENVLSLLNENDNVDICIETFAMNKSESEAHNEMSNLCSYLNSTFCNMDKHYHFYYESLPNCMELRLIETNQISLNEKEEETASLFSDMDFDTICDIETIHEYLEEMQKLYETNPEFVEESLSMILEDNKKKDSDKKSFKLNITKPDTSDIKKKIEDGKNNAKDALSGINITSVKLALKGLKEKGQKLSAKEQQASRELDYTVDNLIKSTQRAMTNDRREAIIKGSIIPSASKCLKISIGMAGVAEFAGPGAAVIALIGMIANSKRLNRKERQLLMDEIEIELKIVDKEINMAESDGNTKKMRTLMQYQKTLQREYQRLKYNMRVTTSHTPVDFARKKFTNKSDVRQLHSTLSSNVGVPGGDD